MRTSEGTYPRLRSILLFVTLVASIFFSISTLVRAQSEPQNSEITLGVSPQLLDLTANPGERLRATFRLTNASEQEVIIQTTPKNFTPRGEEGAVDLTEDRTDFSLAEWISVNPERSTISAKATQDFEVFIDVPSSVEPGSHFGSVVFATVPPEQEGAGAAVSQEIAPVILVKVAGDVVETAEIVEFKAGKGLYSNETNVELLSRIENTGTVHFKPTGRIVIKNTFGRVVDEISLEQRNVLPNSVRQFNSQWNIDGFKMGHYTAELTLVYGDQVTIRSASTSFYIFPYQIIIPVVVVVLIIGFVGYKMRRRFAKAYQALRGADEKEFKK